MSAAAGLSPTSPLRAVVFERSGERRVGRLDGAIVIDAGPVDEAGFVPTPEHWQQLRDARGPSCKLAEVHLLASTSSRGVVEATVSHVGTLRNTVTMET